MVKEMQLFYEKRECTQFQPVAGGIVIVYDVKEQVYKRGQIVECNPELKQYRLKMIDYGNMTVCLLNQIYDLEESFGRLPPLVIWCSLHDIITNCEPAEMPIEKHIDPTKKVECCFINTIDSIAFVDLKVNDASLRETLVTEGIVSLIPAGNKNYCFRQRE